jgi:hypothetical protein
MGEFKYLSETGRYRGKVLHTPEIRMNNFNEEELVLLITVTDGPRKGEAISYHGGLSDEFGEYTVRDLRTMGWKGDDISTISASDLPNEFNFQVYEKVSKDGKGYLKVRYIDSLDRVAPQSTKPVLLDAQKKDFAARFKAKVKAFDAKEKQSGGAPARAASPAPARAPNGASGRAPVAQDDNDDIPF